jgi:hypothetical protein
VPADSRRTVSFVKGTVKWDLFGSKWYHLIGPSYWERRQDFQQILTIFFHEERPFKFPRHLILAFESNINNALSDIYTYSVMFKLRRTHKQTRKRTWKQKRTWIKTCKNIIFVSGLYIYLFFINSIIYLYHMLFLQTLYIRTYLYVHQRWASQIFFWIR